MFISRHRIPVTRINALRGVPMFVGLPDAALARIDGHMVEIDVEDGTTLIRENERGSEAFIVAEGIAEVRRGGVAMSSVAAGDLIGEVSLLDNGPRTATVVALTAMRLYVLDPRQFSALFDHPQTARWIAGNLAIRLRQDHTTQRGEVGSHALTGSSRNRGNQ
jgi:CRP/FNR family cyclic AMP-dependent transcriptional regulator